ncbi:MAG: LysR family transcriptional regulator [Succinivibrio sp.]|nr:LysR family transcriptional regulator [Succinivibrio sp.]
MEFRLLRYFLAVAKEQSITRAARVLHITQPTLSRQMMLLEEETGVTLFHRGSKKILLTSEGFLLKKRAEEMLELMHRTLEELPLQDKDVEGTVSIGIGEVKAMESIARICGSFQKEHPRVRFDIYTTTAEVIKSRMEQGLLDLGLLLEPIDLEKYDYVRMDYPEKIVVLFSPSDPLSQKESVTKEDLLPLPLILPSRLNVQGALGHWFGRNIDSLNVVFTSNLTTNSAVIAMEGYGYPIVAEGATCYYDPSVLISRPLNPPLFLNTVLAWKDAQPFGNATLKFIEFVKCLKGIGKV